MMKKSDFIAEIRASARNGTLLTPKHDPQNLAIHFSPHRTVLSFDLAANLEAFIDSGQFTAVEYQNVEYPNSPLYIVISPDPGSGFSVPSSGVTAQSGFVPYPLDSLVAVSGARQGLHLFGEHSTQVLRKVNEGKLIRKGPLL